MATDYLIGNVKGPKGDTGATGTAATIQVGTVSTLTPGSNATVTNAGTSSAAVFNFGIPQGAKGDKGNKGDTGAGVPTGGTTGQVLKKKSGTNYDTEWGTDSGGHTILDNSGNSMTQQPNLQFSGLNVTNDSGNSKTVVTPLTPDYVDAQYSSTTTYTIGMTCISGNKRYRYINSNATSGHQPPDATYWVEESVASELNTMGGFYAADQDAHVIKVIGNYKLMSRHISLTVILPGNQDVLVALPTTGWGYSFTSASWVLGSALVIDDSSFFTPKINDVIFLPYQKTTPSNYTFELVYGDAPAYVPTLKLKQGITSGTWTCDVECWFHYFVPNS